MRATYKSLKYRVATLNMMFERPMDQFVESSNKQNPGHLRLDKDMSGYRLEEISGDGGSHDISPRMNAGNMQIFLEGLIRGAGLQSNYFGAKFIQAKLAEHTEEQFPLYGAAAVQELAKYKKD